MEEIKFRWVGLNRHFNIIRYNEDLTTTKLLNGDVQSFFNHSNRDKEVGNCKFLGEDLFMKITDINKKNIYVRDIVKIPAHYEGDNWKEEEFIEITFSNEGCEIDYIDVENYRIEKVGTMYENSDLLS